jgi:hypothetical protein
MEHSSSSGFGKTQELCIDPSKDQTSMDQLGDVLHWLRQAISLFCGVVCGAIPLTGAIWLLVFLVLSTGIVYGYYTLILKVDEEEFGGHGTLLQEGLFASVTLFLVHLSVSLPLSLSEPWLLL